MISVDLRRLDRVLDVDAVSRLARVQAGVLGPDLERQLNARGWTLGPLPRLLHALDARRLDRHPLLGHAVRPLRRHRRAHPRGAGRHAGGHARHAPGARHLDRPERARDGARQRGPARRHHRGDRARPPPARRARDPRLPVPGLGRRASPRCATSPPARPRRRSRACRTRTRRAFSFATRKAPDAAGPRQVGRAADLPEAAQGLRHRRRCACRSSATRATEQPRRRAAQARREDRLQPRRAVHRREPGRAVRPEEVRHALHPRLPAGPRARSPTSPRRPRRGARCGPSTTR